MASICRAHFGARKDAPQARLLLVLLVLLAAVLATSPTTSLEQGAPEVAVADPSAAAVIDPPQYLYSIVGAGNTALGRPIGVAIGKDGRVYVSDATRGRVSVFTADGKSLSYFFAIDDGKNKKLVDARPHGVQRQGRALRR